MQRWQCLRVGVCYTSKLGPSKEGL
nr:unnamed protein product [Callosobruchus chinensis]